MEDKVLLIDKPAGITSFGVVARIRRIASQSTGKKVKVGHCGTLDPFATGLLILVTGKETRNAGAYTKLDKVYEATFVLGAESSTGDPEGELSPIDTRVPSRDEIESTLKDFVGDIRQRPPVFSAIKIDGQRAYNLARKGKAVDMPERMVKVYSLELIDYDYPDVKVRAHVGSGTYIRSLGADIGKSLGTGAYCLQLRRTHIGEWDIVNAQTLSDLGVEN